MRIPDLAKKRDAFTLVEVLAALTFTMILLPVAMKGVSLATGASADARRRIEATLLARTLMAELESEGVNQFSEASGDFAPEAPGYQWSARVAAGPESNLNELQVEVTWQSRGSERSVTLATLIYEEGVSNE
ncbi:MAG TPA: hypothetical protein PKN80_02080 [bacterium]|uniref:Bacterial type II secretion system protein I n=1 Tax=candidate division TA06 bacterium ADurb.Bin417 TaxID=1852828 RepID=A0A1V5MDQ1_UNCT6|nr:MAG: hypothetical protein BWY73_01139 [candidate division TA06 bacterium ADurb.Bin417]HNQ34833.1 hypothetical protein [bacterium]HNS49126.1 hypothetical protein [bacterium]